MCLYFNSPRFGWGAWEDWSPNQSVDLYNSTFGHWGNGSGWGQTVAKNTASIVNNTGHTVVVYPSGGLPDPYPSGYAGSLTTATYNNDVSMNT